MAEKGKGKADEHQKPEEHKKPEDHKKPEEHKKDEKGPEAEHPPVKEKSPQPKDEVGTRKKWRRYVWEFKNSNKEFWVMGHGEVKFLSLGCLIAALVLFSGFSVHPVLPLVITMELSVLIFFILMYTFAINRYMPFILWPVSDLLNDLVAFCFLTGIVVFAVRSRPTMHMHYFVAIVFSGLAGIFFLIDVCLQKNHFKARKAKPTNLVPPPPKEKLPEETKGKETVPEAHKGKEAAAAAPPAPPAPQAKAEAPKGKKK
ncbi:PREDICTED: CKLF-like MARVEL transmembrane domain-containing protein 2 [Elephantulus edwardii]|uniref:CKLF-like MARVEL transmembrane domain-containing protein 2 n=1 Tax=Elephantulus edwardii TaxID=28737 RepID=UPI0003F0D834|nr:PREDICTED: CKLF-like MARVEL transmembrane domain-containing protein 2 [Elephantulus edwardii]